MAAMKRTPLLVALCVGGTVAVGLLAAAVRAPAPAAPINPGPSLVAYDGGPGTDDTAQISIVLPQLANTTLTFSRNPGVLLTSFVLMTPPLNRPMCENLSRFFSVMILVSMPPMDRPAMPRFG